MGAISFEMPDNSLDDRGIPVLARLRRVTHPSSVLQSAQRAESLAQAWSFGHQYSFRPPSSSTTMFAPQSRQGNPSRW